MKEQDFFELWNQGNMSLDQLKECNAYTKKFGIEITQEDALELLSERKEVLRENERVEFGESILPKLIFTFCDSPFLYQDNYLDAMERLQEVFYMYKNESLDDVTDDELLQIMKESFDGECQGSLDYLEDTCLEDFARKIREGTLRFMGRSSNEDEL